MDDTPIQLVVSKGPNPGQTYPLLTTSITIGRDPMADIVFNDPEVSRQHVRLSRTPDGYQIVDLGSTNGTFINGVKLEGEPRPLTDGDEIAFGSGVTVLYRLAEAAADSPEPEATQVGGDDIWGTAVPDPFADEGAAEPEIMAVPDDALATPSEPVTELDAGMSSFTTIDEPEPEAPAPPPLAEAPPSSPQQPLVAPGDVDLKRKRRRRTTIIVVVILLLLCCCLAFAISGYFWWGDLLLAWLGLI